MLFVSQVPHIKTLKQRVNITTDAKIQSMYSMLIMNGMDTSSLLNMVKDNVVSLNSKFHFYFIDNKYNGKFFSKQYREILGTERQDIYDNLKKDMRLLNTEDNLSNIGNRNFIYDMQRYNMHFFDIVSRVAVGFKKKSIAYIELIKLITEDPRFKDFKIKTMVIDLNAWLSNIDKTQRLNKFDNPLFYLYFAMMKSFDEFVSLGNINIILYSDKSYIRLNPTECKKDSYQQLRKEVYKLNEKIDLSSDEKLDDLSKNEELVQQSMTDVIQRFNLTGNDTSEIEATVKDKVEKSIESNKDKSPEDVANDVANDKAVLTAVYTASQQEKTGKSNLSTKRDQLLREKQKEIKLNNLTLDEIRNTVSTNIPIEENDVSSKVVTTNPNIKKIRYPHFEKAYNAHLFQKDLVNVLYHLNDRSIPVFVRDIKVEDTSDELNFKHTYVVDLEDSNRVRHRLRFDVPQFIDDKFMFLNGNKKLIVKQLFMKPIVKTKPDEVQICTNYNKMFLRRYGYKVSSKIEKFKKMALDSKSAIKVTFGNNFKANSDCVTTIEYDELSKFLNTVETKNITFYFNQDEVKKILDKNNIKLKDNELCIGFTKDKKPNEIVIDTDKQGFDNGMDIIDFIISVSGEKVSDEFKNTTVGKKYMYTRVVIMKKPVALALLLGYLEGLSGLLRKAGIVHHFTDTNPRGLTSSQGVIPFANGYLVFDRYPFENSLLLNALADVPTKAYNYEDFDTKEPYLDIFDTLYGNRNIGNAYENFYEFMIDPITKEVLEDMNYPTEFTKVVLFANAMLADNAYTKENDMRLYRVRSNELVNAYLYKEIANAYSRYRSTASNNNPVKISIPQDIVLKKLLTAQTIEDYSTLNPIVELEKSRAITPKGHSGVNLDEAYTQDKRSYDESMLGVMAISTSPDANCGVVRQLTLEPKIISPRGYIETTNDLKDLKDVNLFSPAEMLSPLGVTRDDSPRTAMATKQSKHIIPVEKSSPVLISNGSEQVIPYHLSNDFTIVAKYDGGVVEVNEETGIVVVEYTDKKGIPQPGGGTKTVIHQAFDTKPRVVKNGAGGFYLSNQLICKLKKGQKFKKNDIIAYDKKFFSESKNTGVRFNIGSLQKVAFMSSYITYEDSAFITKKMSEDMAADIIMQRPVVLGKNANVDYLVKVGQEVKVGDPLIKFELSFEEDALNKFLSSVGDELKEEIKSLGKTPIKSKYSGVIEDIKVYSTVDLDDMSPSLRKIVKSYYDTINKKKRQIEKYDKRETSYKCGILLNEPTDKIETKDGKLKGHEVGDGVLIEIYIKYRDIMGVGDKITDFTAIKSIVGEVLPEGYEPYSEFRPDEEISKFVAPGGVLARMTPSILQTAYGNKVLIELKRSLFEIYYDKEWEDR